MEEKNCLCFVVFCVVFSPFCVREHRQKQIFRCVHEQRGKFPFCPPNCGGVVSRTAREPASPQRPTKSEPQGPQQARGVPGVAQSRTAPSTIRHEEKNDIKRRDLVISACHLRARVASWGGGNWACIRPKRRSHPRVFSRRKAPMTRDKKITTGGVRFPLATRAQRARANYVCVLFAIKHQQGAALPSPSRTLARRHEHAKSSYFQKQLLWRGGFDGRSSPMIGHA